VKYALLFIVLTFLVFFVWELFRFVLLHQMQYVFVGFALCVFYLLLRLEDYALLAGSVGLFVVLANVMYLTRRMNWYKLRLGGEVA
jgi:inner membrane protein